MSEGVVTAIVAAAAAIVAAVVTALSSSYAAQRKVKEIELVYAQRLRENYLTNARSYTGAIYIPLSTQVSDLASQYEVLQTEAMTTEDAEKIDSIEQRFRSAAGNFLDGVNALRRAGAGAFLTSALEERLESFCAFLKKSLSSEATRVEAVFSVYGASRTMELSGRWAHATAIVERASGLPLFLPIGISRKTVLEAPIRSEQFERRFRTDVAVIRFLIKEVTLGAHA